MSSMIKTAASISSDGTIISGGSILWTTPLNATSDNGLYTSQTPNSSPNGARYLVLENFGFNIPLTAIIEGFKISIKRFKNNSSGEIQDTYISLKQGGSLIGNNVAVATNWPTTVATQVYGGETDMMGTVLTPLDINNSNFGLVLRVYNAIGGFGAQAHVDVITLEVFYSDGPTPTPSSTPTVTPTLTITPTPTTTGTPEVTPTMSPSVTPSATITPTPTVTPSTTPVLVPVTEGFDITISNGIDVLFLDPESTICNGTIRLPSSPVDKQTVEVLTSQKISTITVLGNGNSLVPNPPTIMLAGSGFSYRFNAASGKWFRRF